MKASKIDDVVRKTSELARLKLSNDEIEKYSQQLANILEHVEALKEVNVQGIEPLYQPHDMELWLREDAVEPPLLNAEQKPKVLDSAPETLYEGYKVPSIV